MGDPTGQHRFWPETPRGTQRERPAVLARKHRIPRYPASPSAMRPWNGSVSFDPRAGGLFVHCSIVNPDSPAYPDGMSCGPSSATKSALPELRVHHQVFMENVRFGGKSCSPDLGLDSLEAPPERDVRPGFALPQRRAMRDALSTPAMGLDGPAAGRFVEV